MSESDVVFMLIFSGVALALGLIAEANKRQDERPVAPSYRSKRRRKYIISWIAAGCERLLMPCLNTPYTTQW